MPAITGVQVTQKCKGRSEQSYYPCISALLQQPPPLSPFVQQFVRFFQIARRTSSNNIGYVIASTTRKWDYVVSMPYKAFLGMVLLAIITAMLLPLYLLLKLFSGERSGGFSLEGAAAMCLRSMQFSVIVCMVVLKTAFSFVFTMLLGKLRSLPVLLALVLLMILHSSLSLFTLIFLVVPFSTSIRALFATISESIRVSFVFPKVRVEQDLFAFRAPLAPIWHRFWERIFPSVSTITLSACRVKIERAFVFWVKIHRSGRKVLLAFRALLCGDVFRYDVHAIRLQSLSSRLRLSQVARGHHIYTSFYHKSASEATLGAFYCPISNFLEA